MAKITSQKRTTIYEVAKRANVSVRTVSRYVNKSGYVGEGARGRVKAAIGELDYFPSSPARSLSKMRTMMIGIALYHADYLARSQDSFFPLLVSGLMENLGRYGYGLQILETCSESAEHNRGVYFLDKVKDGSLDGLVLADSLYSEEKVLELQQYEVPFVLAGRLVKGLFGHCVIADDFREGYLMAKFLFERGHKNVAYFGLPLSFTEGSHAMDGIDKAARECGGHFNSQDVIKNDKNVMNRMIELLERKDAPTAVVCATTHISFWLAQLLRGGLRVPCGFEFAGVMFGNELLPCEQLVYVSSPKGRKIGLEASRLLLDIINGREEADEPVNVGVGKMRPVPNDTTEVFDMLRLSY